MSQATQRLRDWLERLPPGSTILRDRLRPRIGCAIAAARARRRTGSQAPPPVSAGGLPPEGPGQIPLTVAKIRRLEELPRLRAGAVYLVAADEIEPGLVLTALGIGLGGTLYPALRIWVRGSDEGLSRGPVYVYAFTTRCLGPGSSADGECGRCRRTVQFICWGGIF